MHVEGKSVILIVNDDLTSSVIFTPLILSDKVYVKLVVFDGKLVSSNEGMLSGAWSLLKKISKRYWFYQSFLMICYQLASMMPSCLVPSSMLPTLRQACRMRDIPYITCRDINEEQFVNKIRILIPDELLIRCSQIVRKPLIESVNGAVYCVHSSLLPSYKGIAAEYHAMVNGEACIGTSIFHVVEKLDAGDVLLQTSMLINEGRSHYWHVMQNNRMASNMIINFVKSGRDLNQNFSDLNIAESYFSWPMPKDMNVFKREGWSLIKFLEVIIVLFSVFIGIKRYK